MASWGAWSQLKVKSFAYPFGYDPWACPDTMALHFIYPHQSIRWCFLTAHPEVQHDVSLLDEFGSCDIDFPSQFLPSQPLIADHLLRVSQPLRPLESGSSLDSTFADSNIFIVDRVDAYLENDVSYAQLLSG
jgi:hypothetical protein